VPASINSVISPNASHVTNQGKSGTRRSPGSDPATRAYAERRTAEGKSKAEIIRCLKRYVAREVYPHLRPADR